MIKKWALMNEFEKNTNKSDDRKSEVQWINQKNKYTKIWWSKVEIQWINQKTSTNDCKRIIRYFAVTSVLQNTDQNRAKNKLIVVICI